LGLGVDVKFAFLQREPKSTPIKHKKRKSREISPLHSEDLHLPIALRNDTRTCTNISHFTLYPTTYALNSYHYKAFIIRLNTTTIARIKKTGGIRIKKNYLERRIILKTLSY